MAEIDWHGQRANLLDLALLDCRPSPGEIDAVALRGDRRDRVRAEMAERDIATLRPGISEPALWSALQQSVIADGGDDVETRLLTSRERTDPWRPEAGSRVIGRHELVALDTDIVGFYGYCAGSSRTFHAGPDAPKAAHRELCAHA